jgi:hypothetical protein
VRVAGATHASNFGVRTFDEMTCATGADGGNACRTGGVGTEPDPPVEAPLKTAARSSFLVAQIVVVTILTVAGLVVVAMLVGVSLPSPFSTSEVAHPHEVTVDELQDVSTYTAATQHLTAVIDIEERADHLPPLLKGERVVFVAEGDVEATVDFSQLTESGIDVGADGTSVTVHLPEPQLTDPRLDPSKSSVVARDRGLIDRAEDALSSTGSGGDQRYYEEAERQLADTADRTELRTRAEANTRAFVEDLFTSAGYEKVIVVFDAPSSGAAA